MERKKYLNYGIPSPAGFETLMVGTSPVGLNPPPAATHMLLAVQLEPVRWRADADPTSTVGIKLFAGDYLDWMTSDLDFQNIMAKLKFVKDITAGAGESEIQVQYFS